MRFQSREPSAVCNLHFSPKTLVTPCPNGTYIVGDGCARPGYCSDRIPQYRLHRPTGLGVVRLNGRDIYLGLYGTSPSRQKYERVIAEWLAHGRVLPPRPPVSAPTNGLAMCELMLAFLEHAKRYYVKNGTSTGEYENVGDALRPVAALFDKTPVAALWPTIAPGRARFDDPVEPRPDGDQLPDQSHPVDVQMGRREPTR